MFYPAPRVDEREPMFVGLVVAAVVALFAAAALL
jgi:hypothetical protein